MKTTSQLGQRFARNLDLVRQARGLTTDAFTREAGVTRQLLSLWRTGQVSASLETVGRVADRLGLEPSALIAREPAEVLRGED